jgi:hypothetical protein
MAPLSWDNCVVLRALDAAPINASAAMADTSAASQLPGAPRLPGGYVVRDDRRPRSYSRVAVDRTGAAVGDSGRWIFFSLEPAKHANCA